ncbi:hypothetical protein RBB50_008728 [Rhinocladiella similis]
MVEYVPPPQDLSHLNPVQKYMQKGHLDRQDYIWLFIIVLAYFSARPYIQKFFKWWMGSEDQKEGEQVMTEYFDSKAKVGPNAIRGTENEEPSLIPEKIGDASASGSNIDQKGGVVNRKAKGKSGEEQLLDWDDEPARQPAEGDKTDVVAWMDKWTNDTE